MHANLKRGLVALAAAALSASVAVPAHAEGNGTKLGPQQRLSVDGYCLVPPDYSVATPAEPPITEGWASGSDSPTDAKNDKALQITIPAADSDCYYYVESFTGKSIVLPNVPAGSVRNLSFEFQNTASFGGGAPRFSVQTADGDVLFADAAGCNNPLTVKPSWSRADFTGRVAAGCTISFAHEVAKREGDVLLPANLVGKRLKAAVTDTYSSDGTDSAWTNFAQANPTEQVSLVYMVFDAGSASTYRLDRVAIPNGSGTAKMFNNRSDYAVNCTTEASC